MKKKFIVLDVEGCSNTRPYNVGYIIADKYGKIYKKHSFAFPECYWENICKSLNNENVKTMTHKNIQEILADTSKKKLKRKYKTISVNAFFNLLKKEIERHKINEVFAYNVTFDKSALNRLFGERFSEINVEYNDIITAILYTKLLTKKYITFARQNNYLTEKGHISTKAENVYKYLTGDINFKEEHTGLADVMIEYFILLSAFKTKQKMFYKPCQAWRVIDKYIKEKNI